MTLHRWEDVRARAKSPKARIPTHPAEIAREEFGLVFDGDVTQLSAAVLAAKTKTTPEFWLNLQVNHDAAKARERA
jgi:plasmid maintenance system antidote protein VapI